jgi:hypothetical protein
MANDAATTLFEILTFLLFGPYVSTSSTGGTGTVPPLVTEMRTGSINITFTRISLCLQHHCIVGIG